MKLQLRRKDVTTILQEEYRLPDDTDFELKGGYEKLTLSPEEVAAAVRERYGLADTVSIYIEFENVETEVRRPGKKAVKGYTSSGALHCNQGTRWPDDDESKPLELYDEGIRDYIDLELED